MDQTTITRLPLFVTMGWLAFAVWSRAEAQCAWDDPAGTAPMPTRRSGLSAVAAGERIYAIGGFNGQYRDEVEAFDPATRTWQQGLSPMPTPRTTGGATLGPDGRIYVVGGSTTFGVPVDTLEAYDPLTNRWVILSPMTQNPARPRARWGLVTVAGPDGLIYAIGGSAGAGPLDYVDIYDAARDRWTEGPALPFRAYYAAASLGPEGRIYVAGGLDGVSYLSDAAAFDTITQRWTSLPRMPSARSNAAAAARDGLVYVFAGGNAGGQLRETIAYDPALSQWITGLALIPNARISAAAAMDFLGHIHVIGGALPGHYFDSVQTYVSCLTSQAALTGVPCSQESSLRSGSGIPTTVEFINNRDAVRRVYWLSYSGERVLYASLNPGQGYLQSSFDSHPWVITDASGQCEGIYVSNSPAGGVEIGAVVDELTATIDCSAEPTLRSESALTETSIQFVNQTASPLRIYWLNYDGEREPQWTLQPGQSYRQSTFLTHPWVVTGANDVCQRIYQPGANPTRATRTIIR